MKYKDLHIIPLKNKLPVYVGRGTLCEDGQQNSCAYPMMSTTYDQQLFAI